MKLSFNDFELEIGPNNCEYDVLKILDYKGSSVRLCGDQTPPDVISSGRKTGVIFKSDDLDTYRGLSATITFVDNSAAPTPMQHGIYNDY